MLKRMWKWRSVGGPQDHPQANDLLQDSCDSETVIQMVMNYYSKRTQIKVSKDEEHIGENVRRNQA